MIISNMCVSLFTKRYMYFLKNTYAFEDRNSLLGQPNGVEDII